MGRKALPDQVKELRGTVKKCRTKTSSSITNIGKPITKATPPAWLQPEARKIFVDIAKMLISWKVLTKLDIGLLAAYATAYANMMKADQDIADKKSYFYEKETRTGTTIEMHPAAKMLKDSIDLVNKLGSQFGLSPISRKGLDTFISQGNKEKKEVDVFECFLQ